MSTGNPCGSIVQGKPCGGADGTVDVLDNGVLAADAVDVLDFVITAPLTKAIGEPVAGIAKIEIGSTAAPVGAAAPVNVLPNNVAAAGASTSASRQDHVHALPSAAPVGTGTANGAGTANSVARSDHVHQTNVAIEDEGTGQGNAHTIDFVGAGVTAAVAAGKATVTIPGGGGGVSDGTEFRVIVSGGGQVSGTLRRITANGRTCVAICATLGGSTTYLVQWRSVTNTQTSTLRERTINAHTSGGSSSAVSASGPTTTSSDTFSTLHTLVLGAGTWFFCFTGDVETP